VADGQQGEEAKWRFRVTHTDGEKLAQPMILYPSWINEEFMIFERYLTSTFATAAATANTEYFPLTNQKGT
jgi:hypothetical protein